MYTITGPLQRYDYADDMAMIFSAPILAETTQQANAALQAVEALGPDTPSCSTLPRQRLCISPEKGTATISHPSPTEGADPLQTCHETARHLVRPRTPVRPCRTTLCCSKAHNTTPTPLLFDYPWTVSKSHEASDHLICTAETIVRRKRLATRAHKRRRCDQAPPKTTDTEDCQEIAGSGQHRLQSSTTSVEDELLHQYVARSIHPTNTTHTLQPATTRCSPHMHTG